MSENNSAYIIENLQQLITAKDIEITSLRTKCTSLQIVISRTQNAFKKQFNELESSQINEQSLNIHQIIVKSLQDEIKELKQQLQKSSSNIIQDIEQSFTGAYDILEKTNQREMMALRLENQQLRRVLHCKCKTNDLSNSAQLKSIFNQINFSSREGYSRIYSFDILTEILEQFCLEETFQSVDLKYLWCQEIELQFLEFLSREVEIYTDSEYLWCKGVVQFIVNGGRIKNGQYLLNDEIIMIV